MVSCKYVYIPANSNEVMEEKELQIPEGKDVECLLDELKRHFTRSGPERTEQMKQAQKEMLMKQLGDNIKNIDPAMLNSAINMQMVENIMLLPNSPETGFVGVNMYCDDQAQLKNLEPNPRASQMALCCGKAIEVRGDAFIARVFDNEDNFKRMDFTMQEMSSSADWVRKAADIARRKQEDSSYAAQKEFLNSLSQKGVPPTRKAEAPPRAQVREITPAEVEKDEGNAAFKKGDWQTAVERYTVALQLDAVLLAARNNRALALLKLGRHEEAEQDCTQVLEKEPHNVKALLRRVSAREQQGKTLEALADAEAALKLEPNNKEAQAAQQRLLPPPPPLPAAALDQQSDQMEVSHGAEQ